MIVSLIKGTRINNLKLPDIIKGSFWVTDYDSNNNLNNIINIEAFNGSWKMFSNEDVSIISNNKEQDSIILSDYSFYVLKLKKKDTLILLYCSPSYDKTYKKYLVDNDVTIKIGSSIDNNICFDSYGVDEQHAKIEYNNGNYYIVDNNSRLGTYVNNIRVRYQQKLTNGDLIFITGLKIIILMENDKLLFIINNPNDTISIDDTYFKEKKVKKVYSNVYDDATEKDEINFDDLYKYEDYFHKKSRKKKEINKIKIHIDPPPEINRTIPFIYHLIPMFTILIILLLIGICITVNHQLTISAFVFCLIILIVMFSWYLILNKKYIENEDNKKNKYIDYVKSKQNQIKEQMEEERQILLENNLSIDKCQKTIMKHKPFLWERKLNDKDFLNVNLGEGTLPVNIQIDYHSDHVDTDDEILTGIINELNNDYKYINNAPVILNLIKNYIIGLYGSKKLNKKYIDRLILQLISYHSYDNLKIIILTTKNNESSWDYLKILPHNWNNDKSIRFFATTEEEITNVCNFLNKEFKINAAGGTIDHHNLIITDNFKNIRNYELISNILNSNQNYGFEFIALCDNISNLPKECISYIEVSEKESILYNDNISFEIDFDTPINMYECCKELANIPLDINTSIKVPLEYDFLEMFNVGTVEQLNSINRWNYNNPSLSLKTAIGIGNNEEKILLDIHERMYGPNGIVAGSSGSGKTNFLITYILSMAVNYHPNEVQFVLVDQENGELVNTFDNKELCIKLPHLVGTITDYNTNELKRVLLALKLELQRRKDIFNNIKDYVVDSNMDIYKYQSLYRQHKVKENLSHLIIIVDKYEELKYTNPKFLQYLNNLVRIGRLYGFHIIYSSSDYVEDQIYSNSRFKINLNMKDGLERVSDVKESYLLNKSGRFYLQVGNDITTIGLTAFSKGKYYPNVKYKKEINTSLDFVDNIGFIYKSKDKNQRLIENAQGNILNNTLVYLDKIKNDEKIIVNELWLNNIPNIITVSSLIKKYKNNDTSIKPIIGEYDDPYNKKQDVLRLDILKNNAIVYSINHKELVLNSILTSSIKEYTPIDLNYYILDLDKELLGSFTESPLVGNVIYNGEDDKIKRLFNYLYSKIEERKKVFSIYGDIETYNNTNELKVPILCVMINNIGLFINTYSIYKDKLVELLKIGHKYGISFVFTSSSPKDIDLSIKQNIDIIYSLDISKEDSLAIYNIDDFEKAKEINGRGLVKNDTNIYEFQTAFVDNNYKEEYEHIRKICTDYSTKYKVKASSIPTLPNRITFKDVKKDMASINELIIGYNTNDLSIVKYDFTKAVNIITGNNIKSICNFVSPLIKQFSAIDKSDIIVIDASGENFIKNSTNIKLVNNSFNSNFINLEKFINEYYEKYLSASIKSTTRCTNIFICGIDNFINQLSSDNQSRLQLLFKKIKEINVINLIIIDSIDNIEKYETNLWYNLVDNTDGIWVGNGIVNQFSIRINEITKELCDDIPNNFCYVIKKGETTLVQYIENYSVVEN